MEWGSERQEAREQVQTVLGFKTKGLHHQNSFATDPRQYKLSFEDEELVPPAKILILKLDAKEEIYIMYESL